MARQPTPPPQFYENSEVSIRLYELIKDDSALRASMIHFLGEASKKNELNDGLKKVCFTALELVFNDNSEAINDQEEESSCSLLHKAVLYNCLELVVFLLRYANKYTMILRNHLGETVWENKRKSRSNEPNHLAIVALLKVHTEHLLTQEEMQELKQESKRLKLELYQNLLEQQEQSVAEMEREMSQWPDAGEWKIPQIERDNLIGYREKVARLTSEIEAGNYEEGAEERVVSDAMPRGLPERIEWHQEQVQALTFEFARENQQLQKQMELLREHTMWNRKRDQERVRRGETRGGGPGPGLFNPHHAALAARLSALKEGALSPEFRKRQEFFMILDALKSGNPVPRASSEHKVSGAGPAAATAAAGGADSDAAPASSVPRCGARN